MTGANMPANDDKAERYPPVEPDDSAGRPARGKGATGERRSFEGEAEEAERRLGDSWPDPSLNQGHMGTGGDPAEGKR